MNSSNSLNSGDFLKYLFLDVFLDVIFLYLIFFVVTFKKNCDVRQIVSPGVVPFNCVRVKPNHLKLRLGFGT